MRIRIEPDDVANFVKASGVANPLVLVIDEGFYFYIDARVFPSPPATALSLAVTQNGESDDLKWLRDYVEKTDTSQAGIAKEIGITKVTLRKCLAENPDPLRKTASKIRAFRARKERSEKET